MKNGKYTKKRSMPKGKRLIAMLLCMVLLGAGIGATIAYLNDKSNTVTNTFIPAEVKIEIEETFEANVKSNVQILNPDTNEAIPAYIRAQIVVNWKNAAGEILGKAPVLGEDYAMSINKDSQIANVVAGHLNETGQWNQGTDDFYYWKGAVKPGYYTGVLIAEAKPLKNAPVEGYTLNIDILASAVQSMPDTAVTEYWGAPAAALVK